ncbi:MAG TPA: DUF2231 domain-containing protein [Gammaproteobacteria bacterium]
MFEITPNWHPAIVHFPIALLLSGIAAIWVSSLLSDTEFNRQLQIFGHWNLRAGFILAVIAAWFGLLAYMSVSHDETAHAAKNIHRDWAIVTISAFIPFFFLSLLRRRLTRHITRVFTVALIIPAILLLRTAWLGGETVYRYGVGVEPLQTKSNEHHTHSDDDDKNHDTDGPLSSTGDMRYPDQKYEGDKDGIVGDRKQN